MKLDRIKYNIFRDFRILFEFKKKMGEFLSNFEKKIFCFCINFIKYLFFLRDDVFGIYMILEIGFLCESFLILDDVNIMLFFRFKFYIIIIFEKNIEGVKF